MPDINRVIKGLEACINGGNTIPECEKCPYATEQGTCTNLHALHQDALELLNAMKPRVLIPEEITNFGNCETLWVEERQTFTWNLFPMEIHYQGVYSDTGTGYIVFIAYHDLIACDLDEYNRTWRCWSARPTPEQREAAKWDG